MFGGLNDIKCLKSFFKTDDIENYGSQILKITIEQADPILFP